MLAGTCLLDGNTSDGYSAGTDVRYDNRLNEAAIRILYTVANSNAMNFIGEGTEIIRSRQNGCITATCCSSVSAHRCGRFSD